MTIKKVKAKTIRPQMATILLISIVAISAIIWAIGISIITDIFAHLNFLQEQPPMWVEAPMVMSQIYGRKYFLIGKYHRSGYMRGLPSCPRGLYHFNPRTRKKIDRIALLSSWTIEKKKHPRKIIFSVVIWQNFVKTKSTIRSQSSHQLDKCGANLILKP